MKNLNLVQFGISLSMSFYLGFFGLFLFFSVISKRSNIATFLLRQYANHDVSLMSLKSLDELLQLVFVCLHALLKKLKHFKHLEKSMIISFVL